MAQIITAQFITDTGFATGLTPTVTIYEALSWTSKWVFNMTETSPWNYIYQSPLTTETVLYFFNIDAWSDSVINRYQGNNNKIETATFRTGWSSITYNKVITDKEMSDIAEKVAKNMPEQKEIVLDTSKIEEKLGVIEDKIDMKEIDFDYWQILSWQEKNKLEIIKKIDWINIPVYDDQKVIEAINKIELDEKSIELEPMKKGIEECCMKIDWLGTRMEKESKAVQALKKVKEQISNIEDEIEETTSVVSNDKMEEIDPEDMKEGMMKELENDEDFKSLINE